MVSKRIYLIILSRSDQKYLLRCFGAQLLMTKRVLHYSTKGSGDQSIQRSIIPIYSILSSLSLCLTLNTGLFKTILLVTNPPRLKLIYDIEVLEHSDHSIQSIT